MDGLASRLLLPAGVSESGRPVLFPTEVECHLIESVCIEFEDTNGDVMEQATLRHGITFLTTHRVIWMDVEAPKAEERRCHSLPLAAVTSVNPIKKSLAKLWASPRLRLRVNTTKEGALDVSNMADGTSTASIVLVFRGQASPDPFVLKFMQVHKERAWESDPVPSGYGGLQNPAAKAAPSKFNPAMAGVGGILRKEKENLQETDKSLQDAFSDLNALMAKAKDMVQLAERMRAKLLAPATLSTSSEDEFGSKEEMQDWLLSVGIVSPVTKESAGAHYHQQLSRQLADFLRTPLQKAGGLLAVVDAYCLFNRARGTELISPEDMLRACAVWDTIDVPMKLRRFDSGVAVIQRKTRNEDEVSARIVQLVKEAGGPEVGVSASDVARALEVAPALAKEELLAAESRGLLCRDDSTEGLRFHINFFRDICPSA